MLSGGRTPIRGTVALKLNSKTNAGFESKLPKNTLIEVFTPKLDDFTKAMYEINKKFRARGDSNLHPSIVVRLQDKRLRPLCYTAM